VCVFTLRKKAGFIVQARARVYDSGSSDGIEQLVERLLSMSQLEARDYLWAFNLKGLGMKEVSHFLRNIGHGDDLAMLDSHIVDSLVDCGLLERYPSPYEISRHYETIEGKMRQWATRLGLSLGELDIVLWSSSTGGISR
jgi:N-glycosylase/DNA lyase